MSKDILSEKEFKWVSLQLSLIILFIYVISILAPDFFFNNFSLLSREVIKKPWTLLTSAFLHSHKNFAHVFYNMFALVLFGSILEKIIGYKKFLLVFILSSIFSSLVGIHFYESMIGSSGGVMGIIGCLTIIKPRMIIFGFGAPMPIILLSLFWVLGDILGMFYADEVAHISHLAGIIFGFLIGIYLRKKSMKNRKEMKIKKKEKLISEEEFRIWEDRWMRNL